MLPAVIIAVARDGAESVKLGGDPSGFAANGIFDRSAPGGISELILASDCNEQNEVIRF